MGHISGTWELLLREYRRKSMIIGEQKTDRATKTSLFDNLCRVHEIAYWFGGPSDKNVSSY